MAGSGTFTKLGSGTMTLSGNNSYTGTTFVSAERWLINRAQPGSPVTVQRRHARRQRAAGTINASAGTVSPGASPGLLNSSNVTFGSSAAFTVELNGTTPGVSYDQLNVTGTVNIANCSLNVSLGFTPALGNSFVIIVNDGADAVSGTFAGLPEGATFLLNGIGLSITYSGGSGNDVVLTAVSFATGVTKTWDAAAQTISGARPPIGLATLRRSWR